MEGIASSLMRDAGLKDDRSGRGYSILLLADIASGYWIVNEAAGETKIVGLRRFRGSDHVAKTEYVMPEHVFDELESLILGAGFWSSEEKSSDIHSPVFDCMLEGWRHGTTKKFMFNIEPESEYRKILSWFTHLHRRAESINP